MKRRLLLTPLLTLFAIVSTNAQTGLSVSVHCDEPGTLFVKIQEQIEEVGELADVTSLTVSGTLNRDDYNVIRNQMTNLASLNLAGIDDESTKAMSLSGKKRLKTIVFSTVATQIPSGALSNCDSLQNFTIPASVTTIGRSAFENCKSLTSIALPSGLTTIESSVFSGCSSLSTVPLPPAITTIGSSAFSGTALTAVTIPATVTKIENSAYRNCQSLTTVTFQGTGVTLSGNVFRNTGLTSYTLPPGVVIDGDGTFCDCANLKRIDARLLLLASLDLGCLSAGQDQTLLLSVCCDDHNIDLFADPFADVIHIAGAQLGCGNKCPDTFQRSHDARLDALIDRNREDDFVLHHLLKSVPLGVIAISISFHRSFPPILNALCANSI